MNSMTNKYPKDFLALAHKSSSSHRSELMKSAMCGCFYCEQTYPLTEIREWIEESVGETAFCPKCGVDSVLRSKFPIVDKSFLKEMNNYWF